MSWAWRRWARAMAMAATSRWITRSTFRFPAAALRRADGRYEVRITEELSEVSYLDQIQLYAVDHPAGTEIFTNEKFKAPPYPEFRLFGVKRRIYPRAARATTTAADVLPRSIAKDQRYPDQFPALGDGRGGTAHARSGFRRRRARPARRSCCSTDGWTGPMAARSGERRRSRRPDW